MASLPFLFVGILATSQASAATNSGNAASSAFVAIYADIIQTGEVDATPEEIIPTSDNGFLALALSNSTIAGVDWLLKFDAAVTDPSPSTGGGLKGGGKTSRRLVYWQPTQNDWTFSGGKLQSESVS